MNDWLPLRVKLVVMRHWLSRQPVCTLAERGPPKRLMVWVAVETWPTHASSTHLSRVSYRKSRDKESFALLYSSAMHAHSLATVNPQPPDSCKGYGNITWNYFMQLHLLLHSSPSVKTLDILWLYKVWNRNDRLGLHWFYSYRLSPLIHMFRCSIFWFLSFFCSTHCMGQKLSRPCFMKQAISCPGNSVVICSHPSVL